MCWADEKDVPNLAVIVLVLGSLGLGIGVGGCAEGRLNRLKAEKAAIESRIKYLEERLK